MKPLFDLAEWIAAHPQYAGDFYEETGVSIPAGGGSYDSNDARPSSPFRMNGSVTATFSCTFGENWAYIQGGALIVMIGGPGQGMFIMLNGDAAGDNSNVDLDTTKNLYSVKLDMEVVDWLKDPKGAPIDRCGNAVSGSPTVRLNPMNAANTMIGSDNDISAEVARAAGAKCSVTSAALPAGTTSLRLTVNNGGAGLILKISDIVFEYLGGRERNK
ncbi:MAG: hypothetical protein LBI04_02110 [Treponema sp.]|jgi:hypothetical protein|nr:hypothetical protein [Treponema sp.]